MRAIRFAVVVATIVVAQVAVLPHLRVAGVVGELGLVAALAVGFHRGPEAGALVGFVAGFGYDLFLDTPVGLSALAYALVGYGVGVVESALLRAPRALPVLVGLVGGLAGGLVFVGVGVLVGIEGVKGTQGVVTVALAAGYDAVLAPFAFFVVGRFGGRADTARASWLRA
jgi:rod shape-determining protein MreD